MRDTGRDPGIPSRAEIAAFRRAVIAWFGRHGRRYPWRAEGDPYRVLIAEMMLRRTRADQVLPVYERFVQEFPDIDSLAAASPAAVARILAPLGLRWRIPAFIEMARQVRDRYGSRVPDSREDLLSLPGVGDYVAGAVLCIAFGRGEWFVDVNTVRVFSRYFGIGISGEGRRNRRIVETARIYMATRNPAAAAMGLLDLAALICRPRRPLCTRCPVAPRCRFRQG